MVMVRFEWVFFYLVVIRVKVILWNSQGVCSLDFKRYYKLLVATHRPSVVAIFKPRVSGLKADRFVERSGFANSYRIEANGFSKGIWVLWRDRIVLNVQTVSNQFFHAEFRAGVKWNVNNGCGVEFWNDIWVTNVGPLREEGIVPAVIDDSKVVDWVDVVGNWDWQRLWSVLPLNIVDQIANNSSTKGLLWGGLALLAFGK
ncbi:hypothetical protein V6N13_064046 [Hibiscus sabdariffa]